VSQNSSDTVKRLVRSVCQVSTREVPWVGLGRRSGWTPKTKMVLHLHTPHPRVPESDTVKVLVRRLCRVSAREVAWVSLGRPVLSVVGSH